MKKALDYKDLNLKLVKEIDRVDIQSVMSLYEHPCGAKIIRVANDCPEMFYCSGYRTIVENSKGIPHILEHSTLSGSKKYPVSDIVFSMMKIAMPTFLNAMTYPDKTVYPVASANYQDFCNLVDVYLDALYQPLITKEIFTKEGIRLEFNKDGNLEYQGVVYNEMKGALSNHFQYVTETCFLPYIFPDNGYRFESGGNPEDIIELGYEEFKNFYTEKYHPANSLTVVYGRLSKEQEKEVLSKITSYFDTYKEGKLIPVVKPQQVFENRIKEMYDLTYPALELTDTTSSYINIGYLLPYSKNDYLQAPLVKILISYLFSENRPCFNEIMSLNGVNSIMIADVDDCLVQNYLLMHIDVKQGFENLAKVIQEIFEKHLKELVYDDFLEGVLAQCEYSLKKSLTDNAQNHTLDIMQDFSKGFDTFDRNYLNEWEDLKSTVLDQEKLKKFIDNTIFKCQNVLLQSFKPDTTINLNKVKNEKAKLVEIEKTIDEKMKQEIIEIKNKINDVAENSESDYLLLPKIALKDLKKDTISGDLNDSNLPFLLSLDEKSEILQISFFIKPKVNSNTNSHDFDIQYLDLFIANFFTLPTNTRSSDQLQIDIKKIFGKIVVYTNLKLDGKFQINLGCGLLSENFDRGVELLKDLFSRENFSSLFANSKNLIKLNLQESLSTILFILNNKSETIISEKLNRSIYDTEYFKTEGMVEQQEFFTQTNELLDKDFSKLCEKLETASQNFFGKNFENIELLIAIKSNSENQTIDKREKLSEIFNTPSPFVPRQTMIKLNQFDNKNLITNQSNETVYYHYQTLKVPEKYQENVGLLKLLTTVIKHEYGFPTIRFKGGAYSYRISYDDNDKLITTSTYRDPRYSENLQIMQDSLEFLANFKLTQDNLDNIKISTLNTFLPYRTKDEQFANEVAQYVTDGYTSEDVLMIYNQIYNAKAEDLILLAKNLLINSEIQRAVSLKVS
jgi:presequence protease